MCHDKKKAKLRVSKNKKVETGHTFSRLPTALRRTEVHFLMNSCSFRTELSPTKKKYKRNII